MRRVFISYRRSDSLQWANKLHDHLSMRFGKDLVFQDVDGIEPGSDWVKAIRQELKSSKVFLVLIGSHWLIDRQGRRRLNDRQDVLRMEIIEALSSKGTVIPVLVGGARRPSPQDLPGPLKPLLRHQTVDLKKDAWIRGVESLIERMRELVVPTRGQMSLQQATQELEQKQREYFELLENNSAEALDLAQKTQASLDRVLPLYPQDPRLKVTRGYLFKNEAMALGRLGRYKESEVALAKGERIFRTMIKERRRDAGAWNGLGSIEAVRGNLEKAHEYVDKALTILPDYPDARQDHAQILAGLGRKTCAVMKKLATSRPTNT